MGEQRLRKLIEAIYLAHQDSEMDCERCAQELDCMVENVAAGAKLADLLPAVEAHLKCCADCREEFEALLVIIRAENRGELTTSSNN
jgi:hypothetical protein